MNTYGVSFVTNDEKLQIIKRWCHRFSIESTYRDDGMWYGQIWLYDTTAAVLSMRTKKYYEDTGNVIDEAYSMLRTRAWSMVKELR